MKNIELQLMAQDVARRYVENGADLNESIAKLASARGLSRTDIANLVAAANHATSGGLRKVAAKGGQEFDLATVDGVLSHLDAKPTGVPLTDVIKVANAFIKREGSTFDRDITRFVTKTAALRAAEKTATLLRLEKVASRAANYGRVLSARDAGVTAAFGEDMRELKKLAKEYIYSNRGKLRDMHKYAQCMTPQNPHQWRPIFEAVGESLRKEAHPTNQMLADATELAAPDNFDRSGGRIPGPDVEVINGRTALYGLLHQVKCKIDDKDSIALWKKEVDNLDKVVRQITHTIQDNESVGEDMFKFAEELDEKSATLDGFCALVEGLHKTAASGVESLSNTQPKSIRDLLGESTERAIKSGVGQLTRDYIPGTHKSRATAQIYRESK